MGKYKRKIGRHKKPGPKKKKPVKVRKKVVYDFKVVRCDFNKKEYYVGKCHNAEEAKLFKKYLEDMNNQVIFPKKYSNNGRKNSEIYDFKSEYLILKKTNGKIDSVSQLRNEFGKLVDHKTNEENWIIYDKFPCLTEETFWAYGHNPKTDRKTFQWIYDNFVNGMISSKFDIVNIYLYNNKVIFRYDGKEFNFVICKNTSDAIRMYNLLEEWCKKNKQVIFTGTATDFGGRKSETIEMIQEKTGWDLLKIYRTSTRA